MRRLLIFALVLLALSACAAPAKGPAPVPPAQEAPAEEPSQKPVPDELPPAESPSEDHVLLTLDAPLANGRTLTLEAVGRIEDAYTCGVREVRVYDGEKRIQTVLSREAIELFWGDSDGGTVGEYTTCWSPEGSMAVLDLNFDGNTDFGLFGWPANNTIPYYYWTWDEETQQYRYAFVLQEAKAHPETGELTAEYKSGTAGSQWIVESYRPDENGELYLVRVERDTCDFEPDSGLLDVDRGWAHETWAPPEGGEPIPPGDGRWSIEADLVLLRREFPVLEVHGETASHFTEIWERRDGTFQMTSREEDFYEGQPQ